MVKKADNRTLINNIDKDGKIVVPQKSRSKFVLRLLVFFIQRGHPPAALTMHPFL